VLGDAERHSGRALMPRIWRQSLMDAAKVVVRHIEADGRRVARPWFAKCVRDIRMLRGKQQSDAGHCSTGT